MRRYRILSVCVALLMVAVAAGRAQEQSTATESVSWSQISASDPVKIVRVLYNGQPIESRVPFQGSTEWLKGLSVEVENVSHKTLTYIDLTIVFRTLGPFAAQFISMGQLPEHHRLARDGSGRISPDPNQPISIGPGQRIVLPFGLTFASMQEYVSKLPSKPKLSNLHYCALYINRAFFTDGMMWQAGAFFKETHDNVNTYDRSTAEEFYGESGGPSHE